MEDHHLYQRLADDLANQIRSGAFRPGERLPSVRALRRKLGLSVSTVYQALGELEATGLIQARPRSGFYVNPQALEPMPAPSRGADSSGPAPVSLKAITASVVSASRDPKLAPFGASTMDVDLYPHKHLARIMRGLSADGPNQFLSYEHAQGSSDLRRLLAQRLVGLSPDLDPDQIIITNGCMEAVSLALFTLTEPGQVVATENPTHFGFLQLLRELRLKVVEVPADPRLGLDPDGLAQVLERHKVAACLLIPNFHNPLGSLMPTERKARVMEILSAYRVPVIEDDVYGELYFGTHRPDLLRSHDPQGLVISCGSLSKVMAPGFRVGWALAESSRARDLARLKAGFSIASPSLEQAVLVEFLKAGAFDRFMRSLRTKVHRQVYQHVWAIRRHFPPGCRLAEPQGGNLLWVELPPQVDAIRVHTEALAQGISLVPGPAFTSGQGFGNYLRMSCTRPLDDRLDNALERLGRIIARLAGGAAQAFPAAV